MLSLPPSPARRAPRPKPPPASARSEDAPPAGRPRGARSCCRRHRSSPPAPAAREPAPSSSSLGRSTLTSNYSSKLLEEGRSTSCAPCPALSSYGFVQQFQEPLARGFFDHLDVRLVPSHDRRLVVIDDRLTSAPLSTRLHGHEAALGPRRDRRVEGHGHRYRVRQLEPPVPFVEDDPLDVDAELR